MNAISNSILKQKSPKTSSPKTTSKRTSKTSPPKTPKTSPPKTTPKTLLGTPKSKNDQDNENFFLDLSSSSITSSSSSDETVYYKNKNTKKKRHSKSKRTSKRKNTGCVQLDLADLEASLNILNANLDTTIDQLQDKTSPVYVAYENVKLFISMFYGRDEYSKITEILNTYSKPKTIKPNSIGAFLFGCLQSTYGDISNKYCSPLCLQSVFPDVTFVCCPYQVWILNETSFEQISDTMTDKAYIFSSLSKTLQFTPEQINLLKEKGIHNVHVLETRDTLHKTLIPLTHIDNLPQVKLETPLKPIIKQVNNVSSMNSTRLLGVLLFLLIIGLLIWLIYKYIIPRYS